MCEINQWWGITDRNTDSNTNTNTKKNTNTHTNTDRNKYTNTHTVQSVCECGINQWWGITDRIGQSSLYSKNHTTAQVAQAYLGFLIPGYKQPLFSTETPLEVLSVQL